MLLLWNAGDTRVDGLNKAEKLTCSQRREFIERPWRACPCTTVNLVAASSPDPASGGSNKLLARGKRMLVYRMPFMVPIVMPVAYAVVYGKKRSAPRKRVDFEAADDLKPGDRVQVRSEEEISSTLNSNNVFKGLGMMPEMVNFFGGEYKVFKKVDKILIESTGELRRIKSPTYMLEGVLCDGGSHQGCDRSCYIMWKREWLKKL